MKLKCLGSGSSGNCYLLIADNGETLILEAGISASNVFKEIKYENIAGLLISHQHGDHAGRVHDYTSRSIDTYMSEECFKGLKLKSKIEIKFFENQGEFNIGSFKVLPFKLEHDMPCYGFLIAHPDCGNILFCTDTRSIPYNFPSVGTLMIEADYDMDMLQKNIQGGVINRTLGNRIMSTHLSIDDAINFAIRHKKSLESIILLHLSKNNANGDIFKQKMTEKTGLPTYVAKEGLEVKLGLPF